ncbi:MAG: gas vesicle structural protein GvpA [Streptosporangiales bacterium]|nr:gas vesicle structural protein GvpA [Streptosporangiales bacterium]MBO0889691.1 gas vesicle structural protein GvpA [Acidothermales bacterium]
MTVTTNQRPRGGYLDRPQSSSLADVLDIILDKGLVIDAYVRVSLVGIEVLTIDARIVIASVDTYLRFAEATNRLDLAQTGGKDLPEMIEGMSEGGARGKTSGALSGIKEALTSGSDDDEEDEDERPARKRQPASKSSSARRRQRRSSSEEDS